MVLSGEERDQVSTRAVEADAATTRTEVDRLTTTLRAHLTYEEAELIPLFSTAP